MKKPKKGIVTQIINNALATNKENERLSNLLKERTEKLIESEKKLQIANDEEYGYRVAFIVASWLLCIVLAVFIFNQIS
ncbi:MAG: hypothetical protein KGV51_06895 [Moraxellaceae bacterium]|nr:hypothetical protein [Moraxellaceae bacterium]